VSDVEVVAGRCFLCLEEVPGGIDDHLATRHPTPVRKPGAPDMTWQDRTAKVIGALRELITKPDIDRFDEEVLQELYLVRVRLAQVRGTPVKRVKEGGSHYGSS
jgi:hypothetical protein